MDQDDPADWSVDHVIQELCHNHKPIWTGSSDLKPIINPQLMANVLRNNDIDGDNLLALTDKDIKDDLSISSFGQRRALTNIIAHLRTLSPKYQAQLSRLNAASLDTPHLSHALRLSRGHSANDSSHKVSSLTKDNIDISGTLSSNVGGAHNLQAENLCQKRKWQDSDHDANADTISGDLQQQVLHEESRFSSDPPPRLNPSHALHRLIPLKEIANGGPTQAEEHNQSFLNTLDCAIDQQLDTKQQDAQALRTAQKTTALSSSPREQLKKPPRRIAVVPVVDQSASNQTAGSILQHASVWMPPFDGQNVNSNDSDVSVVVDPVGPPAKRMKLCHVPSSGYQSFTAPALGHPSNAQRRRLRCRKDEILEKIFRVRSEPQETATIDVETSFIIFSSAQPHARALHASRCVRLAAERSRQQLSQLAITSNSVDKDDGDLLPVAFKEWAQANPNFDLSPELQQLLHKHTAVSDDATLPFYGDSDEDDRWTSGSKSPTPEDRIQIAMLTQQEVDTIIDECLQQFRLDWRARSLHKFQDKAHKKWMAAAKNTLVHDTMLDDCKSWQNKFSARIHNLRQGIHLSQWRKPEEVKEQCKAIETSLHQLEEYTLYVTVLENEQEPTQLSRKVLSKSRSSQSRVIFENGDEELGSDDDSDQPFIINDDSESAIHDDPMSIDHEPPAWNPQFANVSVSPKTNQKSNDLSQLDIQDTIIDSIEGFDHPMSLNVQIERSSSNEDVPDTGVDRLDSSTKISQKSAREQATSEGAERNPTNILDLSESSDDTDIEQRSAFPRADHRERAKSRDATIDLTMSSSPPAPARGGAQRFATEIRTPSLSCSPAFKDLQRATSETNAKVDADTATTLSTLKRSYRDEIMDVRRVTDMEWEDIEPSSTRRAGDNQLALAKSVYNLSLIYTRHTIDYLRSFDKDCDLADVLRSGLIALKEWEDDIADVNQRNQRNARRLVDLLMSYALSCKMDSEAELSESEIDKAEMLIPHSVSSFRQLLDSLLQNYLDHNSANPPSLMLLTANDDGINSQHRVKRSRTSGPRPKGRGRKEVGLEDVYEQQRLDRNRAKRQEEKRTAMLQQQSVLDVEQNEQTVAVGVEEPLVYLDAKFSTAVKPHQIQGIQFMWREIIENPRSNGCLLAHTMGLGKTFQTIAVLASIAQCNTSKDPAIQQHIPKHLRGPKLRTMILCPYTLIENWYEELLRWLPDAMMLGVITKLDNLIRQPEVTIETWYNSGGVLIISYDRFRSCVAKKRTGGLVPEVVDARCRWLTEGPDIVIADEAHRLKNANSAINRTTHQIVTRSRMALTGSPLSNFLEEYHTMIDWISPNYLGDISQFKAKYIDPINKGLYSGCTKWERKETMKKLHILKEIIRPKVDRADLSVISSELPQKTEFILTITMTKEQKEAYQLFVEDLRSTVDENSKKLNNARLWTWLSVLSLLLNHPTCFIQKLEADAKKALAKSLMTKASRPEIEEEGYESANSAVVGNDDVVRAEDVDVTEEPVLKDAMQRVVDVFMEARAFVSIEDPSLSNKTMLIKQIIEEAVDADEKTLLFSKSIPTLNYFEKMIKEMELGYKRIDGSAGNGGVRHRVVAEFNKSSVDKVLLVSTRAGGLGLNIQGASRVIINDFDFNPTWEEQAIGRAYRMGQKKDVFVYRFLTGGTYDELVHNKAVFKTQLFTRVIDERNVVAQATHKPGQFLCDPQEVPRKDFQECLGKDPKILDRILKRTDCVRNIVLTETFFQEDKEELNEQELKEANEEVEMEQLRQTNPEEYAKRLRAKNYNEMIERAAHAANVIASSMPTMQPIRPPHSMIGSLPYSHYYSPHIPAQGDPNQLGSVFGSYPRPHAVQPPRFGMGAVFDDSHVNPYRPAAPFAMTQTLFRDDQTAHISSLSATHHGPMMPTASRPASFLPIHNNVNQHNNDPRTGVNNANNTSMQVVSETDHALPTSDKVANNGEVQIDEDETEDELEDSQQKTASGCRPQ